MRGCVACRSVVCAISRRALLHLVTHLVTRLVTHLVTLLVKRFGKGSMVWLLVISGIVLAILALVAVYDLFQRKHAILRNFPIIGHFRYLLEAVGPELRQYIVTSNDEEKPFSRDERRWVYASAKRQNNAFGFGTDNDLEASSNHLIIKHAAFPLHARPADADGWHRLPAAKVLGGHRRRRLAFRPESAVNVSGMSYGSLSGVAIEALNRGAKLGGFLHNTGEGGVSPHHDHGGELIWQIGTGYFGCRASDGGFDVTRFQDTVARFPVRAIEVKLSQGAKPGKGGLLPAAKVSAEIAAIRGIPMGQDCESPAFHRAFRSVDEMLDFVERLADLSGLPVGIKSAVGESVFWMELADRMAAESRAVDFITIDGGEGGTGAAPLVFSDHVALPFKIGMSRVYRIFAERGVAEQVVWIGSGRLNFPDTALLSFALGCDLVNVGRAAMLAIGCIQAQRCHSGHCPTGVATQSRWLQRGLDPTDKGVRCAQFVDTLRKEISEVSAACGVEHPALISPEHFEVLDDRFGARDVREVFRYESGWGLPSADDRTQLKELLAAGAEVASS